MHQSAFARGLARSALLLLVVALTACSSPKTGNVHSSAFQDHFAKAEKLLEAQEYRKAIVAYSEALQFNAESPKTFYRRGIAYAMSGFPDTAIYDFDASIRRRPDHAGAYYERAKAYMALGRHENVIRDCTRALRLQPDFAEAHRARGESYLETRRYERAIADLNEAILLNDALSEPVNLLLGIAYLHWSEDLQYEGKDADAKLALERAIELNSSYVLEQTRPPNGPPLHDSANPQVADQQPALPDNTRIETLKPVLPDSSYNKGIEYLEARKFDEAITQLTVALKADPRYADAYLARGVAFYEKGFPDTALADLGSALLYDRSNVEALYQRARVHADLENHALAIRDCTEAIRWNTGLSHAYEIRAKSYISVGHLKRARADIEEAARLGATDTKSLLEMLDVAYQERANQRVKMQALNEAMADLSALQNLKSNSVSELQGRLAQAFYDQAKTSIQRGELDHAADNLTRIRALNASLTRELKSQLARAYHQRGLDRQTGGGDKAAALDFRRAEELGFQDS